MPHSTAALLVGLRPSTLTSAFREASRLDSIREARLLTVSARCVELRDSFHPFGLPGDYESLQALVDGLTSGRLTVKEISESVEGFLGSSSNQ